MDTTLTFLTMPYRCPIGGFEESRGCFPQMARNFIPGRDLLLSREAASENLRYLDIYFIYFKAGFLLFAEPLPVFNRPSQVCLWEKAAAHETSRCFLCPPSHDRGLEVPPDCDASQHGINGEAEKGAPPSHGSLLGSAGVHQAAKSKGLARWHS